MGVGCDAALGVEHPWRGEAGATLGGGARSAVAALPCFSAGGGTKASWGRVGQKAKQAGGAVGLTGPKAERNSFSK
jgi:hypothetical protein